MVATNDDLLLEMQKQTAQLKKIKNLIRGTYDKPENADTIENQP
jgi:hypothetical protein